MGTPDSKREHVLVLIWCTVFPIPVVILNIAASVKVYNYSREHGTNFSIQKDRCAIYCRKIMKCHGTPWILWIKNNKINVFALKALHDCASCNQMSIWFESSEH